MRPFGCHVTILNTLDYLGKFDGKSDEGFFVGYSMNSKAFRVYNIRTRKVEENLHIRFLEDKPIIAGDGPKWLFNIDVLTKSMNYVPIVAGTNSNDFASTKESIGAGHSSKETRSSQDYILMPLWKDGSLFDSSSKNACNDEPQPSSDAGKKDDEGVNKESGINDQERPENSTQDVNTAGPSINTADLQSINEELAEYINTPSWNLPTSSYDDDDDEYSFATQEYLMTCSTTIIPDSPITDSLIMEDKHLDTISEMESDEFIKSSVENLVQNPSESEDECECDVPDCDDSQTTFFNPLFDDSSSSDDESSHEEKNDRFDTESYLLESLLNRDTLMASSPKIDSLFDEFAGELITIPPRIVNRENEEYISLLERLLYDNSTPLPPKAFQANSDTIIESLPTFPIPVKGSDSLREEIDIFLGPDDSIPPGIESDDDVVEDIPVDVLNIFPTHLALQLDFDFIPSNDLGSDLDVSSPFGDRNKIYDSRICIEVESTRFLATLSPVIDTLLLFSSENEVKVFNHGVLASKEKSPSSSSHRGFKPSKIFHQKSPMLIYGGDIPLLDVPFLHFYPP
ncbi:putative ribonuclease H-like domain-containing protein [Tanacetum coccineum]